MVKEWIIGREGKNLKFKGEALLNYGIYIGLQIKPTTFKHTFEDYKWKEMQEISHHKFQKKFGGQVFTVFSVKEGNKKVIHNPEVIEEIRKEVERLEKE